MIDRQTAAAAVDSLHRLGAPVPPAVLVAAGYQQTSRTHYGGHVAGLPLGKTGIEALAAHDPRLAAHLDEGEATRHYLCYWAAKDGLRLILRRRPFTAFLKAGGRVA